MNLENLNLVELNAQEVQETEGGFWMWLVAEIVYELKYEQASIRNGYNDAKSFFN